MNLRCVFLGAMLLLWPARLALADPQTPEAVIQSAVQSVLDVLRDPKLQAADQRTVRIAKLRKIADGVFDWTAMAQSSLGVYWRSLDDQHKADFVDVFKQLLARQYIEDLDQFTGAERVQFKGTDARPPLQVVKTILVTQSHETLPIDYLMGPEGARWIGVDVNIQGVSLVNHYRSTFRRFLVNHTFDALIAQLKNALPPEK